MARLLACPAGPAAISAHHFSRKQGATCRYMRRIVQQHTTPAMHSCCWQLSASLAVAAQQRISNSTMAAAALAQGICHIIVTADQYIQPGEVSSRPAAGMLRPLCTALCIAHHNPCLTCSAQQTTILLLDPIGLPAADGWAQPIVPEPAQQPLSSSGQDHQLPASQRLPPIHMQQGPVPTVPRATPPPPPPHPQQLVEQQQHQQPPLQQPMLQQQELAKQAPSPAPAQPLLQQPRARSISAFACSARTTAIAAAAALIAVTAAAAAAAPNTDAATATDTTTAASASSSAACAAGMSGAAAGGRHTSTDISGSSKADR
jgi:hypothetical protein